MIRLRTAPHDEKGSHLVICKDNQDSGTRPDTALPNVEHNTVQRCNYAGTWWSADKTLTYRAEGSSSTPADSAFLASDEVRTLCMWRGPRVLWLWSRVKQLVHSADRHPVIGDHRELTSEYHTLNYCVGLSECNSCLLRFLMTWSGRDIRRDVSKRGAMQIGNNFIIENEEDILCITNAFLKYLQLNIACWRSIVTRRSRFLKCVMCVLLLLF